MVCGVVDSAPIVRFTGSVDALASPGFRPKEFIRNPDDMNMRKYARLSSFPAAEFFRTVVSV